MTASGAAIPSQISVELARREPSELGGYTIEKIFKTAIFTYQSSMGTSSMENVVLSRPETSGTIVPDNSCRERLCCDMGILNVA